MFLLFSKPFNARFFYLEQGPDIEGGYFKSGLWQQGQRFLVVLLVKQKRVSSSLSLTKLDQFYQEERAKIPTNKHEKLVIET